MTAAVGLDLDAMETAQMVDDISLDRELTARSLREYIEMAWPHVEPSQPFRANWHVDAMCDVLEACKRQEILRLVINVPPGVGKSLISTVLFPTWLWSDWPGAKLITASYGADLAEGFAIRSRGLMESPWWKGRWGHQMTPNKSMWSKSDYRNKQGGMRLSVGASTGVVGQHGHIQIADDPHKPQDVTGVAALSKANLEKTKTWWNESMATRVVDRSTAVRIIIMQRLHESDIAGLALAEGGYHHLCLPMEYVPKFSSFPSAEEPDAQSCPIKNCKAIHDLDADPRTEPGELLDPLRSDRAAVETQKRDLGSARAIASQLAQSPAPAEGLIFKRSQIRYYRRAEMPKMQRQLQSWDMTFKETKKGSFVVGQAWGQVRADFYLLDQVRQRMGMSDTCKAVKAFTVKWPKAYKKLVEAKANGEAVVDMLRKEIPGFKLINPEGGKESRAHAVEHLFEGGNVYLPHPEEAPWVIGYEEELLAFPFAAYDDQVDTTTQALTNMRRGSHARLAAAMQNGH